MSLLQKFRELNIPTTKNSKLLNALTLDKFPFAKIGVNFEGLPVILIASIADRSHLSQKNVRLKYLELTHNLECKVSENNKYEIAFFSVIIFKSLQSNLQSYFLGIAESLLQSLSLSPTQNEVFETFKNFIEIFRALSDNPSKTLQGLWAEIFLIEKSKNPDVLLNYWHNIPEERFDFNADIEKLEVKSSSKLERVHIFTSEQLNPPNDKQVMIASIFTKQTSNGRSITDLMESIQMKLLDKTLMDKLYSVVAKTLGNTVEQSIRIKYDYGLANSSLRFYRHQDISKIEKLYIPDRVSEVKYKSDLTSTNSVNLETLNDKQKLFKAL
ncbi:MAG: hypothetical protein CVV22_07695 [Ignavibacteriae bacterium HGW-Ignavibacteriae-1]|jgi:urease gamma subunit|nr:MAG: hypothetical protein CVV22_07695 [Ignavibacteriae bacterium HGW-Ignavibacteriae-1]